MDITVIVIITNTLVVLATFIATLYRIKIERDHIETVKRTAHVKECLESLRKYIKAERNSIGKLDEKEQRILGLSRKTRRMLNSPFTV